MTDMSIRRRGPLSLATLLLLLPFTASLLHAQPSVPKGRDEILLEVGKEKFTAEQIARAFSRNANRGGKTFWELDRDSALQFVNLYANYRLKVQAALDAGVDKRPEVIEDIRSNRQQLAVPPPPNVGYLLERKVVDPAVERIFKRRDDELLLGLVYKSMNAQDPADTLRAYRSILVILDSLRHGYPFERMAKDSSDDPNSRDNQGRLPTYITAGMILPEMEEAGYELQVGAITPAPIRLPGGYVIMKLIDRSPRFKVRAAHILVVAQPFAPVDGPEYRKADSLLNLIRAGASFEGLARENSDDKVSGEQGGDFGAWYTRSLGFEIKDARLEPAFEQALFALKNGEVSDIVRTRYGFHIIKRLDSRKPTFDEEKETIRQFYKQRLMSEDRQEYVRRVVDSQGLKFNPSIFDQFAAALDPRGTTADTAWAAGIGRGLRGETLFSFGGETYTVGAWVDSVDSRQDLKATPTSRVGMGNAIYRFLEMPALIDQAKNLEAEYPEFATLMNEFRDGILIFTLEDSIIWKRLNKGYDEEQGKAYFEAHRAKYNTLPKLAMTEIFLYNQPEVEEVEAILKVSPSLFDSLAATRTQRAGYRERRGRWTMATEKNADIVRQVLQREKDPKPGTIMEPFAYQQGVSIIRIDSVERSRPMTYDEARPEVQSDYIDGIREKLQREWIDTLRKRYRVSINDRTFRKVVSGR